MLPRMLLSVVALLSVADANDARKNANKLCQQSHWYIDGRAMPTTGDIRSKDVEFSKSWDTTQYHAQQPTSELSRKCGSFRESS